MMRKVILAMVAAISLTGGGALYTNSAQAAPLFDGLQGAPPVSNVTNVQFLFLFGGHRYCWYLDGWNGPGWYWCGYASRRGLGYGGGEGWQGHGAPRGGHQARTPMVNHNTRSPMVNHNTRAPSFTRAPGGPAPGGHTPSGHTPSGTAPGGQNPKGH